MPRPKRWCHTRFTMTRAVKGFDGSVIWRASSSRPEPVENFCGCVPAIASIKRRGAGSPGSFVWPRTRTNSSTPLPSSIAGAVCDSVFIFAINADCTRANGASAAVSCGFPASCSLSKRSTRRMSQSAIDAADAEVASLSSPMSLADCENVACTAFAIASGEVTEGAAIAVSISSFTDSGSGGFVSDCTTIAMFSGSAPAGFGALPFPRVRILPASAGAFAAAPGLNCT